MSGLPATVVLDLWERSERAGAVDRAVALAGSVDAPGAAQVAELPLGARDALLLRLHQRLTSRGLEAITACPACDEQVEFTVDPGALLEGAGDSSAPAPLDLDGVVITWRAPTSRDLAAAAAAAGVDAALAVLLARCVDSAEGPNGPIAPGDLPAVARSALSSAMAASDPLAEVLIDLTCPACEEAFVANLDVPEFVWAELQATAHRLLRDIDTLARAYGWTEAEVLALGDRRRVAYLALAREAAP
jgi:hypothetical protein